MRFVIYGAGAIGGVVGAKLHQAGFDIALIARGAHYRAIRDRGLTLEQPHEPVAHLRIPVADSPEGIEWNGDEVVLLATKSQDTTGALDALRAAAPAGTPVVCMQNGVENERIALRLMPNVYGAVVMSPTAHLEPGIVQAYGTHGTGVIDLGRYPSGLDSLLRGGRAGARAGRLQLGPAQGHHALQVREADARTSAMRSTRSARRARTLRSSSSSRRRRGGPSCAPPGSSSSPTRSTTWSAGGSGSELQPIAGRERAGSSTWQSLARGTPTVETDYLNGEIALLGRLHGVPTPVNDALCELSARHVRERRAPQTLPAAEVLALARSGDYADGPVRR